MAALSLGGKDHKLFGSVEKIGDSNSFGSLEARSQFVREHENSILVVPDTSQSASFKGDAEAGGSEAGRAEAAEEAALVVSDLATLGSALHNSGGCKPCDFVSRGQICRNGSQCNFCHFHAGLRRKRPGRKKREKAARRASRQWATGDSSEDEAEAAPGRGSAPSAAPAETSSASKVTMSL
mmetsp:Transcript_103756/g.302852  ORF Transcript_103756/g.302852 Transcript_103756/m.302852 type:complete len:181 (-) Transcript_103756:178-720(-)